MSTTEENTNDGSEETTVEQCSPALELEQVTGEVGVQICVDGQPRTVSIDTFKNLLSQSGSEDGDSESTCETNEICEQLTQIESAPEFVGTDEIVVVSNGTCLTKPVTDLCRILEEK